MPRLNEIIGSMDSQQQQRGLLLLQNVVKSLASKRLRNDRRIFRVRFALIHDHKLWNLNNSMIS